jgi:hypothetical protein
MTLFADHPTSIYERLSTKLPKSNSDFEATERSAVAGWGLTLPE